MRRALLLVPLLLAVGCLEAGTTGDDEGAGPTPGTGATATPPASATPEGPPAATTPVATTPPAPTGPPRQGVHNGSGFRSLESGYHSASREPARLVFTEPAAWEAFYRNHTQPYYEGGSMEERRASPPAVDFASERAVAVLMGQQSSGCHAIRVEAVRAETDAVVVEVVSYEPGPTVLCTGALTQPYHLVAIPAAAQPVRFEEARADVAAMPRPTG